MFIEMINEYEKNKNHYDVSSLRTGVFYFFKKIELDFKIFIE